MKINRLDEVFVEKKVKNRVLARYIKKSESTVSLWRNNKRQPSLDELWKIAQLLRVNIHELIEPTFWDKNEETVSYEEFASKPKQVEQNLP